MAKKNKEKSELLYLTGLSLDKKRLNNIISNIDKDRDFEFWKNEAIEKFNLAFGEVSKILNNEKTDKLINEGLSFVPYYSELKKVLDVIFITTGKKIDIKTIILNEIPYINSYNFFKTISPILTTLIQKENFFIKYKNSDFFNIYLSHQSDSIGVGPLSQHKNINCTHLYTDRDYYENRYVDNIVLKIKKENFEIEKKDFQLVFILHFIDIILSKLSKECLDVNEVCLEKLTESEMGSISKLKEKSNFENLSNSIKSLSERGFFGVSLLSDILYRFSKTKDKLNIKTSSDRDSNEFLKELLSMASKPGLIEYSENDENIDIEAKIYFSDGKELKSEKLNRDDFIESLSKDDFFMSFPTNPIDLRRDIESKIDITNSENIELRDYIFENSSSEKNEKDNFVYIKIPIKFITSVPLDRNGKPNSELYVPELLDKKQVSILTVGGTEHNRALAHLIQKHREEYQEERLFGFMDNYFDFEHKLKYIEDDRYDHSFLMGLNQPVSGFNGIFKAREDDELGSSKNTDVKLIGFRLKEYEYEEYQYNILVIYGFSAIASQIGVFNIVADIYEGYNENKVFINCYSSSLRMFDDAKGQTSSIIYHKNLFDFFVKNKNRKKLGLEEVFSKVFLIIDKCTKKNITELKEHKILKDSIVTNETNEKYIFTILDKFFIENKNIENEFRKIKINIKKLISLLSGESSSLTLFNKNKDEFFKIFNIETLKNKPNFLLIKDIKNRRITSKEPKENNK